MSCQIICQAETHLEHKKSYFNNIMYETIRGDHFMGLNTRELFARLLKCEAEGEGDNGLKAVATVVMNRVNVSGGEYLRVCQGDLRRVIEQECQFSCLKSVIGYNINAQNVWNISPDDIDFEIADWAIGGSRLSVVVGCLWYMNPFNPVCPNVFPYNGSGVFHVRINKHCFYKPTDLYWKT